MLDDAEILALVTYELGESEYNSDMEQHLRTYLGRPDGTEVEGRSQVTSTDVADAVEWILPQVMKSFTQNNEVVIFDPVHEGDEKQAELESEYVYEVLMKQNNGFILLHQFVKDALIQRNGILKVYYAEVDTVRIVSHTGITREQLESLLSLEGVDLEEKTERVDEHGSAASGQVLIVYDVKVKVVTKKGQIMIDSVPIEEFRVSTYHNSICLDDARFTAHVMLKTRSEVVEMGVSKEVADDLAPDYNLSSREYRFNYQDEPISGATESNDESLRIIEIAECYMQMDIEESGVAQLYKITVAGGHTPSEILLIEEIDEMPWVTTTAFLMSHKFQGLSVTDRLAEIQKQKTALWRNMFDNLYLQNNQRNLVIESQVNVDDLLVSRPGGIIRVKTPGAVTPLVTPQINAEAFTMMSYLDQVRAGRVGVDPDGSATPQNIGDRVGSQGVERLMNAKEELVGLIIRVVAETGIKPLCTKIRDLSVRHIDSVIDFRFRGQWQQINPAEWMDRTQCTVRVGTGSGNHNAQLQAIGQVIAMQKEIFAEPGQALVQDTHIYASLDDFCKYSELNGASKYFLDPASELGQQKKEETSKQMEEQQAEQKEMEKAISDSQQMLAQAEMGKAQAQMQSVQHKAQAEQAKIELDTQAKKFKAELDSVNFELDEAKLSLESISKDADLQFKYDHLETTTALELTRMENDRKGRLQQNDNFKENADTVKEVSNG